MLVLVCYDVATTTSGGSRRLRKVARACSGYGLRVQYSVFECVVDPAQWEKLRARLVNIIDPTEDSLRFYMLGAKWDRRIEHVGRAKAPDPHDLLLIEGDGDETP